MVALDVVVVHRLPEYHTTTAVRLSRCELPEEPVVATEGWHRA